MRESSAIGGTCASCHKDSTEDVAEPAGRRQGATQGRVGMVGPRADRYYRDASRSKRRGRRSRPVEATTGVGRSQLVALKGRPFFVTEHFRCLGDGEGDREKTVTRPQKAVAAWAGTGRVRDRPAGPHSDPGDRR